MADECHGALDLPTESLDFTHGFSWTLQTDLLEAVEESPDEICGTKKTWCRRRESLGVGQHAQVVLAYSEQLDTLNHAE